MVMRTYVFTDESDSDLLRGLDDDTADERKAMARQLGRIAEVDARGLYLALGYSSLLAFCVERLRLTQDAAYLRIHVARAARALPILFHALADGKLHLTAVDLLAPYLTEGNVQEFVAAATDRSVAGIRELIASRFPRPEMLPEVVPAISPMSEPRQQGSNPVAQATADPGDQGSNPVGPKSAASRMVVDPVSSDRFRIEIVIDRSTHDKLLYAQELLSHSLPTGDVAQLLDCALDALITQCEKRKFRVTARPQSHPRPSNAARHVPAQVCRAVWKRDGARCTFVGQDGHRCGERWMVELDHITPVARGGRATKDSMRLRCRAHNQYEAERVFGRDFMQRKRDQARATPAPQAQEQDAIDKDVMAGLRELGVRADIAKRAVEYSRSQRGVTLEERMRTALQFLWPRGVQRGAAAVA
jgi:hypothetical protein